MRGPAFAVAVLLASALSAGPAHAQGSTQQGHAAQPAPQRSAPAALDKAQASPRADLPPEFVAALGRHFSRCWIMPGDQGAARVAVSFEITPEQQILPESLELVEASGGTEAEIAAAFDAARRAILRCGAEGLGLPADQYDRWRKVVINFAAAPR